MNAARVLIISVSAFTGTCFAALAGLSISAMAFPVRRFHFFSIVIAAVAICLAYLAFRAAVAGNDNDETAVASLQGGVLGALIGLLIIIILLLLFRSDTQGFLAHALGKRSSSFTISRLMIASLLLGFGTGFIARVPKTL